MWAVLLLGCPPEGEKAPPRESRQDSATESATDSTVTETGDSVLCAEEEVCDGVDNDCDGAVDEEAVDAGTFYEDRDRDGYGNDAVVASACEAPAGFVSVGGDCADEAAEQNPGEIEICGDSVNQSCGTGCEWSLDDAAIVISEHGSPRQQNGAGDINGDGFDDMMFGQWVDGKYYIYFMFGNNLNEDISESDIIFEPEEWKDMHTLGDINNDGVSEVVLYNNGVNLIYSGIYNESSLNNHNSTISTNIYIRAEYDALTGDITGDEEKEFAWIGCDSTCLVGSSNLLDQDYSLLNSLFSIHINIGNYINDYALSKDVNGDGINDIVMVAEAPNVNGVREGAIFVYHGPLEGQLRYQSWDAMWIGDEYASEIGNRLTVANDMSGDGYGEIAVSANSNEAANSAGAVYILSGGTTGMYSLADAQNIFLGQGVGQYLGGSCLSSPGDLNKDGQDDLMIGTGYDEDLGDVGKVFGFYYINSGTHELDDANFSILNKKSNGTSDYGLGCSNLGDLNGDNYPDFESKYSYPHVYYNYKIYHSIFYGREF